MKIAVNQARRCNYPKKQIKKIFRVISRVMPRFSKSEVSVALVDNRTIQRLNKKYRQINRPTDVLSFAELDKAKRIKTGQYLGEIIIAYPYAKRQAREQGQSLKNELAVLLTHGFLHLGGFDHLNKKDEQKMRRLEKTISKKYREGIK